jgi:hypothetical protein
MTTHQPEISHLPTQTDVVIVGFPGGGQHTGAICTAANSSRRISSLSWWSSPSIVMKAAPVRAILPWPWARASS